MKPKPKIIGLMAVKDEADLLPLVYPHVRGLVDYLYVYDDFSQDNTWELVKTSDYAIRGVDDVSRLEIPRPNYHHLLEKIKQDFEGEDVWVVLTMGDRFFLNKTPREIAEGAGPYNAVEGVQLDFLRHKYDPWTEENDPFPDYSNIRSICRWSRVDERCIVAFRLQPYLTYIGSKYPWPQRLHIQYGEVEQPLLSVDMPFLEHQGRRSPKGLMHRIASGQRGISKKHPEYNASSFQKIMETYDFLYNTNRIVAWIGPKSLETLVWLNNEVMEKSKKRYFYLGLEAALGLVGLPPR